MNTTRFSVGILTAVLLAPVTYGMGLLFFFDRALGGGASAESILVQVLFLLAIVTNIALPVYICRQAFCDKPLFQSFNKIPLSFLLFLGAMMGTLIVFRMM